MRITDIQERTVGVQSNIRNAYMNFSGMTCSLVAVQTDVERDGKQITGYGFSSNGRYGQGGIIRERLIPRILEASQQELCNAGGDNLDPFRISAAMMRNEKPGGHGERSVAVGTLDMAIWDAVAKIEGEPLYRLLAQRYGDGNPDPRVFVYAAGGYYYPGKDNEQLLEEIRGYLEAGYTVVKIKIGGESLRDDLDRIEAALSVVGSGSRLAVDANGKFDLATALEYATALEPFGLRWYEEAGDPLDFSLQSELCSTYLLPTATGENLFSMQDVRNLLRYGNLRSDRDILQMDPALSYGLVEYMRMLEVIRSEDWSPRRCIPHGGHQFSLHIAAGLGLGGNEAYPNVFAPFGGFADSTPIVAGEIELTEVPGIGIEEKSDLYRLYRSLFA